MDAGMEALLSVIKQRVKSKISESPRVQALLDMIDSGNATFADTAEYSELVSNALGAVFSNSIPELSEAGLKEYVCTELLKDRYNDTNEVLATVQKSLDEKAGIKLAPQKASFPLERVAQVAHSLEDTTVKEDVITRRANGPVANVSKSFHDDYIEENAKFRNDAGLKCYINRVTDGKCCKWCSAVAGRYVYGEEPEGIYRRHDNCGCTVTYENGRMRQDVWSKKSWEVPDVEPQDGKPTKLSYEQAKSTEKQNSPHVGVDKSGGSGIIKEKKDLSQYIGQPITETDNQHIREWYYANVSDIPNQINRKKDFIEQVHEAFNLRNKYKREARIAMTDIKTVEELETKRPIPEFEELIKNKMNRKGMTRQEALEDILKTASKTNPDINKEFDL